MTNLLLGVAGSVAAILTPELFRQLRGAGFAVKVVATNAATYFFDPTELSDAPSNERDKNIVILDEDEWPGRDVGHRYERGDEVVHIELRRWADAMLIAPLDANTLAKLANGLADNCLTCVWRAWDLSKPVFLAPAMNTLMWEHPFTKRHLLQLGQDAGLDHESAAIELPELIEKVNKQCNNLRIIAPQSKRLACDDVGMGAMAGLDNIVDCITLFRAPTT